MQELPVLAIDLGGTKISAAIISNKGQVIAREYCLTLPFNKSRVKEIFVLTPLASWATPAH